MITLERFRLRMGSPEDIMHVRTLLAYACGGSSPNDPVKAVNNLWDYDFFSGGSFARYHVARQDTIKNNKVVGMVHSAWFSRGVRINALSIDTAYRGRGIGRRVISTIATVAEERGVSNIWLYAKPEQRVIAFYEQLGFTALPSSDYRVDLETESSYIPMGVEAPDLLDRVAESLSIGVSFL